MEYRRRGESNRCRIGGWRPKCGTALILVFEPRSRFQNCFRAYSPLSSPTKTIVPVVHVNHNGEKFVLLANVDFINRNDLQISQTWLAECLLQVLAVGAPKHRITDAHLLSRIPNGHHLSHVDHMVSKGLSVIAQRHDVRQHRIQHLFATPTLQPPTFDEQNRPVFGYRSGTHDASKRPR